MSKIETVTVKEAAALLGVTPDAIYKRIAAGDLGYYSEEPADGSERRRGIELRRADVEALRPRRRWHPPTTGDGTVRP